MTRINFGIIRQAEQTFNNVCPKLLVVASRKVRASDAAAEERVAGEDPTFDFGIEADATHSMARCADDFKGALPHPDDFAVFQITIGQVAVTHKRHPEHRRLLPRAKEVVLHVGMRRHWDAITLFHYSVSHDMIDVAVCADDH